MKSLIDLFCPPAGYFFCEGVGCTYSADKKTLNALERALKISLDADKKAEFRNGETFTLYIQQGEYQEKEYPNYLVPINPQEGCTHAKVYCLKYEKGNEKKYRIIVTSANLTNALEHNTYAVFESENTKENASRFGAEAAAFFRENFGCCKELLKEIESQNFGKSAQFYDVEKTKVIKQLQREADVCLIVSPFLSESVVENIFKNKKEKILVSREDELNKIAQNLENVKCYVMPELQSEDEVLLKALHTKMYVLKNLNDGKKQSNTVVFLGSANATNAAFNQNIEALVGFEDMFDIDGFVNQFDAYTPRQDEQSDKSQEEFERHCREIVVGFTFNNKQYAIKEIPENYTVSIDLQKFGNDGIVQRTNKNKHTAQLKIRDNSSHEKTIIVMIDGDSIPVNDDCLLREIENSICDRLKASGKLERESALRSENKAKSKNESSSLYSKIKSITGAITSVKTKEQAEKMTATIKVLLSEMGSNQTEKIDTLKNMLESAQEVLEDLYKIGEQKRMNKNGSEK